LIGLALLLDENPFFGLAHFSLRYGLHLVALTLDYNMEKLSNLCSPPAVCIG